MSLGTSKRLAIVFLAATLLACGRREEKASDVTSAPPSPPATEAMPKAGVPGWAMPELAFKVQWEECTVPSPFTGGATKRVQIRFKNISDTEWPDPATADPELKQGAYAVRLSYRWLQKNGQNLVTTYGSVRSDLPKPVQPGESVVVPVDVKAPKEAGQYQLQFDLVQELVSWFEEKGAAKCVHQVEVR